jgi:hypothetical protein
MAFVFARRTIPDRIFGKNDEQLKQRTKRLVDVKDFYPRISTN